MVKRNGPAGGFTEKHKITKDIPKKITEGFMQLDGNNNMVAYIPARTYSPINVS